MVKAPAGSTLTPDQHLSLVKERVQQLADSEGPKQAMRLVQDLAANPAGSLLQGSPRPDEMGDALVEGLKNNLEERGALISKDATIQAQPNATQEDWDAMTLRGWLESAT